MPAKANTSPFEKFRKNFWKHFQGWLWDDQPSITYDVDLDESELRQIQNTYLDGKGYPSLNELKKIIIFKNAEDRALWGTDLTGYSEDFNNDLQRGIKKALELARFDLGQVKPKIYQEEKTTETSSVPKEPSPEKKILRVYEAAEIAGVNPKTITRWAQDELFPVNWNKNRTYILGIPRKTFLEYLEGETKNQS